MLRSTLRPLVPALALLTLTLAACGQSTPTTTGSEPVLSSTQASVTLRLPAPQSLGAQYINQSKTTRLNVSIDGSPATRYTLGSATAPCANGFCTVTLLNLSPGRHTFTFGTYGMRPSDSSTVLISQGSLTATLLAGQANTFPLTLTPVNTTLALSSAVKQYDAASNTFGNYVKFTTFAGRSLPAYYDIQGGDSVGDVISSVVCGDTGTAITNISDPTHPNRFRVEVQTPGSHTLSVQAGTTCTATGAALVTQTVKATTLTSTAGLPVTGSGLNQATIGAGPDNSVAVLSDGTVRTLGGNPFGNLGNGTTGGQSASPAKVTGLDTAVGVAAGSSHLLALLSDGTVRSWGLNTSGQLGNGTTTNSNVPVTVMGLRDVVGISSGASHSLALLADGTVRTWGNNVSGQLGNGTYTASSVPVAVSGLSNVAAVAGGGGNGTALLADGTVRAWGANRSGQLGNGSTTDNSNVPVPVTGLSTVTGLSVGDLHILAVLADGSVYDWGYNGYGQLGNGAITKSTVPVLVSGLGNVANVAAGTLHSLALLKDGTGRSWGYNLNGQLGDTTTTNRSRPVVVSGLRNATSMAGGAGNHSLALGQDGTVSGWGDGYGGKLGSSASAIRDNRNSSPVTVTGLSSVAQPAP